MVVAEEIITGLIGEDAIEASVESIGVEVGQAAGFLGQLAKTLLGVSQGGSPSGQPVTNLFVFEVGSIVGSLEAGIDQPAGVNSVDDNFGAIGKAGDGENLGAGNRGVTQLGIAGNGKAIGEQPSDLRPGSLRMDCATNRIEPIVPTLKRR